MAGEVKAEIPGLSKFLSNLAGMARDVEIAFPVAFARPLSSAVREAQLKAPFATGRLSNSIQGRVDADGPYIESDVEYALITEKGGSHPAWGHDPMIEVSARPFLWPAVEETADERMRANKEAVLLAARKAGFR